MENDAFRIAVATIILIVVWVLIDRAPMPERVPPILRWVLLVLAVVVYAAYLLQYT